MIEDDMIAVAFINMRSAEEAHWQGVRDMLFAESNLRSHPDPIPDLYEAMQRARRDYEEACLAGVRGRSVVG